MRIPAALWILALTNTFALAQDPGAMAAQQAMQAAQMANQQAMQDSQQASQNAQQAMQNAQASAAPLGPGPGYVPRPKFSVKPGTYAAPVTVKIKSPRGTTAYYTTDGWTPT